MNDTDGVKSLKIDLLMKIHKHKERYPDSRIPYTHIHMSLQELECIYQHANNEATEFQMNKLKQAYMVLLTGKLLDPDYKEDNTHLKRMIDELRNYMAENGITAENTKHAFIDLITELFIDLDYKETGIKIKMLVDKFRDDMTKNGILSENTRSSLIHLVTGPVFQVYLEQFIEQFNKNKMVDSFCNKYKLTINRDKLFTFVGTIYLLLLFY